MAKEMTMDEILIEKIKVETQIFTLLNTFMEQTGLHVDSVSLSFIDSTYISSPMVQRRLTKVKTIIYLP